jgi:hypothetical protein
MTVNNHISEYAWQDFEAAGLDASMVDGSLDDRIHSRVHLADVLPHMIFPHRLRLGAAEAAASDTASEWMIEDMAATDTHSLRGHALLPREKGEVR